MIDIDHFKRINDSYGHPAGDEVIKRIADLIKACLRDDDSVGRYGGEEFIAVIRNIPFKQAGLLAERVRAGVEALEWSFGEKITVSIGFEFGKPPFDAGGILGSADQYLYEAKNSGHNTIKGPAES